MLNPTVTILLALMLSFFNKYEKTTTKPNTSINAPLKPILLVGRLA
jgi:hypothetical protein